MKKDIKENVSIRKGVIIDLGGHSLSGTDKIPVDINASGKAVTIKNGSIVGIKSAYTGSPAAIKISNTPPLTWREFPLPGVQVPELLSSIAPTLLPAHPQD